MFGIFYKKHAVICFILSKNELDLQGLILNDNL
jgi:hypothetical protein